MSEGLSVVTLAADSDVADVLLLEEHTLTAPRLLPSSESLSLASVD